MNAIRRRRVTIRLPRLPRAALAALAACLLSQMGGTGRLAGGGPVALADAASTAAGPGHRSARIDVKKTLLYVFQVLIAARI